MALRSRHFARIQRFEECLVRDSAHIVPGERGSHVAKVQQALVLLGAAVIGPGEIQAELYGTSTAQGVLRFKGPPRNILNTALGQRTPDNIVGKQTIQALDDAMVALESQPDPNPPATSRLVSLTIAGSPHDHPNLCPRGAFPGPDGRVHHLGTPINPQGFGNKINIGGEKETQYLGFEDVVSGRVADSPQGRRQMSELPGLERERHLHEIFPDWSRGGNSNGARCQAGLPPHDRHEYGWDNQP